MWNWVEIQIFHEGVGIANIFGILPFHLQFILSATPLFRYHNYTLSVHVCTDVTIPCKNLTNALIYVDTTLFTLLLHVSSLKGPSSESTDTFHEQGQQNVCPDVNVWKSKHIYMEVILTIKYEI